jgi:hypothetical protein
MTRALSLVLALFAAGCSHSAASAGNDDGNEAGYPACAVDVEAGAACAPGTGACFSCSQGNGFDCLCEADSGLEAPDATVWFCVGTGYTCQ